MHGAHLRTASSIGESQTRVAVLVTPLVDAELYHWLRLPQHLPHAGFTASWQAMLLATM